MEDRKRTILQFLASKGLKPSLAWTDAFLLRTREQSNLIALQQTAQFQLLAADITTSIDRQSRCFPTGFADPRVNEQRLPGPILAQIIDVQDIGSSNWSQIEAIEAYDRGETTRGHQVIRMIPDVNGEMPAPRSKGPYKLLFEDAASSKVYAFAMTPIAKLDIDCPIGTKVLLRDVTAARGMILLQSDNVTVLGGRVESLDQAWQAERKHRLQERIAANSAQA